MEEDNLPYEARTGEPFLRCRDVGTRSRTYRTTIIEPRGGSMRFRSDGLEQSSDEADEWIKQKTRRIKLEEINKPREDTYHA